MQFGCRSENIDSIIEEALIYELNFEKANKCYLKKIKQKNFTFDDVLNGEIKKI